MLRFISLLLITQAFLFTNPRVVETKYDTDDLIVAEYIVTESPFNADNKGMTDSTAAFQGAIDAAAKLGGGTVYAPPGIYRFDGELVLKSGVTLRGEMRKPTAKNKKAEGTILAIYCGRGKEKYNDEGKGTSGIPFIKNHKVTSLKDLIFWYPEQQPDNII